MGFHHISTLLGLTGILSLQICVPSQAATTFDLSRLKDIKSRPIESNTRLDLFGSDINQQGYTAFFSQNPLASDFLHNDISLNASGNGAPYYVTGRENSPEEPISSSIRTATVTAIPGFTNLNSYLTSNGISADNIGFGFGQNNYNQFTKTWNLGENKLGQDWFASPDSNLEERIYRANPNDVGFYLTFGATKIVTLGYSDIYLGLDYGLTKSPFDDTEISFTDPMKATKVTGLDSLADGLATALLKDVTAGGDYLQFYLFDTFTNDTRVTTGNGFVAIDLHLPGSLRVVRPVPETSPTLGILMFSALCAISQLNKKRVKITW